MTAQEKIAVIQAQEDGKVVQFRVRRGSDNEAVNARFYGYDWHDPDVDKYMFSFYSYDYRVKKPGTHMVRLNNDASYDAEVSKDSVKVGCQTFDADRVLAVADKIKELRYVPVVFNLEWPL